MRFNVKNLLKWIGTRVLFVLAFCVILATGVCNFGCARFRDDPCRLLPPGTCTQPTPEPTATPSPEPTVTPTGTPQSQPTSSPTPHPTATMTPVPGVELPEVAFFKTGGTNLTCKRGQVCCQNAEDSPRFQNQHVCEVGGTLYLAPKHPPETDPNQAGPCDPPHELNWNSFCLRQEWDNEGGPVRNVSGARSWRINPGNPFHTDVEWIEGQCFTICAKPPVPFVVRGLTLRVREGAERCVEHCY